MLISALVYVVKDSIAIHPAIVLRLTTGEIYYGTIDEGPASYLAVESRC